MQRSCSAGVIVVKGGDCGLRTPMGTGGSSLGRWYDWTLPRAIIDGYRTAAIPWLVDEKTLFSGHRGQPHYDSTDKRTC